MEFIAFLIVLIVVGYTFREPIRLAIDVKVGEKKPKAIEPPKTIYDCAVYSDRLFEQKLVTAGVMKSDEMSVCKDNKCENCKTLNPVPKSRLPVSDAAKRRGTEIDHKTIRQQAQKDRIEQGIKRVYELKEQAEDVRRHIKKTQNKIDYNKKRYR